MLGVMKRWTVRIIALGPTAGLLAAGYAVVFALKPASEAPVNGRTLFESVQDRSGSAGELLGDTGSCLARAARLWRCDVTDREGSGGARYRVHVPSGGSCWTAQLTRDYSETGMPSRVTGCVRGDRWSPLDLI